jgi:hypothetical protein
MSSNNYPKRFEILENDGKVLKFRVDKLTKGLNEYFIKHFANGKDQDEAKKITVPSTLEYPIEESGKHTFSFFNLDPDVDVVPLEDGMDLYEDNEPIWEQDVFVIKQDSYRLSKHRIKTLAENYAPFIFMDPKERYLPASINYLLNKDEDGVIKDESLKVKLTLKLADTKDIEMPYNDLSEVLPYNGDNDSILDTIGLSISRLLNNKTLRDALENRTGDSDNVTLYYSYIPNSEAKQQVVINYHFLYAYDSKMEEEGKTKKTSHIFDRESINIVFKWNESKQDVEGEPEYIIYGAHLDGQTMGSVKKDEKNPDKWKSLQKWKCGRVKVLWKDVYKIDGHPIVAVARGSHAPYPSPGHYAVYLLKRLPMLVEPAQAGKVLVPENIPHDKCRGDELKEVYPYKLKDLELGEITSNSWNSILAYCGCIVDIIGTQNAKFPPFTNRELDIDKWVNGDEKDVIYEWNPAKVEAVGKSDFEDLIESMNSKLA